MYLKVQLYSTKFRVPVCCLSVLNLAKFGYGCVTVLPEGTTKFSYMYNGLHHALALNLEGTGTY